MERNAFKILLFRYRPYVLVKEGASFKHAVSSPKKLLFPPLGLAQLAGVLRNAGFENVKIVDAWAEGMSGETLLETIADYAPHVVGCTLWTTSAHNELAMLKEIKRRFPGVKTAVGGSHLDVYPRECFENSDFIDYGAVGDAEETAAELFDAVRTGGDLGEIPGIVFRDGKEVVLTERRRNVKNLDELPYPDFSGLPMQRYHSGSEKTAPFIYIYTARGCPYRCRHCFNSRGRVYRLHSVEYIIGYIKFLKDQFDIKDVAFFDETFTYDRKRTLNFCARYKRQFPGLPYSIRTRVDHVDEEIMVALKESGCRRIEYGVESGAQEVLDKMNRRMTLDQIRKAIALTKKHGIRVGTNFMIGYVDESRDTYQRSVKFMRELNPDHVSISITTVLCQTELYYEALERRILKRDVWREYALGQVPLLDQRRLWFPGKDYSVDDLEGMLKQAYLQIFFSPRFVLRKLRNLRSGKRLLRYIAQATSMLSASIGSH